MDRISQYKKTRNIIAPGLLIIDNTVSYQRNAA